MEANQLSVLAPGRPHYWLRPEYRPLRIRRNLTAEQVGERCRVLVGTFMDAHDLDVIYANGLDNPYMSDDARQIILNLMAFDKRTRGTGTTPSRRRRALHHSE